MPIKNFRFFYHCPCQKGGYWSVDRKLEDAEGADNPENYGGSECDACGELHLAYKIEKKKAQGPFFTVEFDTDGPAFDNFIEGEVAATLRAIADAIESQQSLDGGIDDKETGESLGRYFHTSKEEL